MVKAPSEDNLYENQHFGHSKVDLEPIYMNEINDGGSSGYRSSSSPSIHSEENLYENRAVALSLEEISMRGSQEELREIARHDVAIETTLTLERQQEKKVKNILMEEQERRPVNILKNILMEEQERRPV